MGFWEENDNSIQAWRLYLFIVNKKKRTCSVVHFTIPADQRVKVILKEIGKFDGPC